MIRPTPADISPWIQTESGRAWPLDEPSPGDVHWPDIAASLAKLCRFNGHCQAFYSVAQHCCLVADMLPVEFRIYGLLHDAHEAFIGDITAPLKAMLRDAAIHDTLSGLETRTDRAVFLAAGLPLPIQEPIRALVKGADLQALATEQRDLMAPPPKAWMPLPPPHNRRIVPWPWPKAMDEWLSRLETYKPVQTKGRP